MKRMLSVLGLTLLSCTLAWGQTMNVMAKAELQNPQGETIGVVTFSEGNNGVMVVAHVHHLTPGWHGFHIHETGKCTPPDFESAGEHFNPFAGKHGLNNPTSTHAGDMPNLLVGPDGIGTIITHAPLVTLREGKQSLFQSAGTAVVIHAQADDFRTDPAGNAGERVACGVIQKISSKAREATLSR